MPRAAVPGALPAVPWRLRAAGVPGGSSGARPRLCAPELRALEPGNFERGSLTPPGASTGTGGSATPRCDVRQAASGFDCTENSVYVSTVLTALPCCCQLPGRSVPFVADLSRCWELQGKPPAPQPAVTRSRPAKPLTLACQLS